MNFFFRGVHAQQTRRRARVPRYPGLHGVRGNVPEVELAVAPQAGVLEGRGGAQREAGTGGPQLLPEPVREDGETLVLHNSQENSVGIL